MIRVLPCGAFQNRQPLAYGPILARLGHAVELVDDPADAQIALISHCMDLQLSGDRLARMRAGHPGLRIVLLSEEPFWDTGWSPDPFGRDQIFPADPAPLPVRVLNHQNSAIYRTARIPYFLLTDPRYIARYRRLFDRNAGRSVADWLAHFRAAEWDAAFLGEKRLHDRDRIAFPEQGVWGLSYYRTRFALRCTKGRVLRSGRGWEPGADRLRLEDWHGDKLSRLDLRCRHVAAFENTLQADYISEKPYDAFAVGAVPLYFAGPGHAIQRLIGAPEEAGWLDFHALPPEAPDFDPRRPVSLRQAEAYTATQERLARLFADPALARDEIDRFGLRLVAELRAALA